MTTGPTTAGRQSNREIGLVPGDGLPGRGRQLLGLVLRDHGGVRAAAVVDADDRARPTGSTRSRRRRTGCRADPRAGRRTRRSRRRRAPAWSSGCRVRRRTGRATVRRPRRDPPGTAPARGRAPARPPRRGSRWPRPDRRRQPARRRCSPAPAAGPRPRSGISRPAVTSPGWIRSAHGTQCSASSAVSPGSSTTSFTVGDLGPGTPGPGSPTSASRRTRRAGRRRSG